MMLIFESHKQNWLALLCVRIRLLSHLKIYTMFLPLSMNQSLQLEQKKLLSDYDKLRDEEQEKDEKLQKLM